MSRFHFECIHERKDRDCPGYKARGNFGMASECSFWSDGGKPQPTYTAALREKLNRQPHGLLFKEDIDVLVKRIVRLNKKYGK